MKQDEVYYRAMISRDKKFDGKFFVGVKTTGVYCRPICPARPNPENVEFFRNFLEAEKAGYRPCMRCRPESAPRSPAWIGTSAIVQRALRAIHHQKNLSFDEDDFSAQFGVSARHLRRVFIREVGKTPRQLANENRLDMARKLIHETHLSMTEIAYASGFGSIRRFNDAFQIRFKKSPTQIRRKSVSKKESGIRLFLSYRPPYDFDALLASYKSHQIGNLERFENGKMIRKIFHKGQLGEVRIQNDPEKSRLIVEIECSDTSQIYPLMSRVRNMFDLDADPAWVANTLEKDKKVAGLLNKHPGIRIASGWDPFEIAIGTILGQLVSVDRARALVADLIELLGEDTGFFHEGKSIKFFPTPQQIADSDLASLKTTGARKETLKGFCRAILRGELLLDSTQDVDKFIHSIRQIKGIGDWTSQYIALKAVRHADAFPATDLILQRKLRQYSSESISKLSPWRGYVAALFWKDHAENPQKTVRKKHAK